MRHGDVTLHYNDVEDVHSACSRRVTVRFYFFAWAGMGM